MAAYDLALQYILDDTRRPDLQAAIIRRIQRAVTKFHMMDHWKKDLIEQAYVFENPSVPAQIQQLDTALLVRFRKFSYVRKWQTVDSQGNAIINPNTGLLGTAASGDIVERALDRMFDGYGGDVDDIMYWSGHKCMIRSSTPIYQVFIGYYTTPLVTPADTMISWILDEYPSLIAAEVKKRVFKDIGKDQEAADARQEVNEEILILQANNIRLTMS